MTHKVNANIFKQKISIYINIGEWNSWFGCFTSQDWFNLKTWKFSLTQADSGVNVVVFYIILLVFKCHTIIVYIKYKILYYVNAMFCKIQRNSNLEEKQDLNLNIKSTLHWYSNIDKKWFAENIINVKVWIKCRERKHLYEFCAREKNKKYYIV